MRGLCAENAEKDAKCRKEEEKLSHSINTKSQQNTAATEIRQDQGATPKEVQELSSTKLILVNSYQSWSLQSSAPYEI